MMLAGETAAFGGVYGLLMAFWEGLGVTGGCTTHSDPAADFASGYI